LYFGAPVSIASLNSLPDNLSDPPLSSIDAMPIYEAFVGCLGGKIWLKAAGWHL